MNNWNIPDREGYPQLRRLLDFSVEKVNSNVETEQRKHNKHSWYSRCSA
jgi:hypothetical protein